MSVVSAALVPAAPVLVPGIGGTSDPAAEQRAAALAVVRAMIESRVDRVVVIAEGDRDEEFEDSEPLGLHRLGGLPGAFPPVDERQRMLPLPLAIGASLLREAGWQGATAFHLVDRALSLSDAAQRGHDLQSLPQRAGLLLLGNGSACSSAKAPGSFHPDAEAFNSRLQEMVSAAESEQIASLTADQCREQLSDIRVPLQMLSGACEEWQADIRLAQEFQGVLYVCAHLGITAGESAT